MKIPEDMSRLSYPGIDQALKEYLEKMRRWDHVDYSLSDQLCYLYDLAVKFGLRDAAEWLSNKIQEERKLKELEQITHCLKDLLES